MNLESPTGPNGHPGGTIVGSVVYDGLPSIDPTVCAGSTNFSGQRSAGQTVEGSYFSMWLAHMASSIAPTGVRLR